MKYDIINLIKLLHLDSFNIDYDKTYVFVPIGNVEPLIIHLFLTIESRTCPHCNSSSSVIHDRLIKKINHPSLADYHCIIYFYQTKFKCKICNKSFLQNNPLIYKNSKISLYGELQLIEKLRNPRMTFKDISTSYKIPLTSVIRCFDKYVDVPRHDFQEIICLDEFYSKKLTKTKYAFAIFDPSRNLIIDILNARLKYVLIDYFASIPIKERLNVKYICIDMWPTYADVGKLSFPNSIICIDSFHVIQHLVKAMDKIRIRIQKQFLDHKEDDKLGYYWVLKNFHYYLTMNMDNIKYKRRPNSKYSYLYSKYDVLDKVLSISPILKTTYNLKEEYREFNIVATHEEAQIKLYDFIYKFRNSDCTEFREFGRMLDGWKNEILNSFLTYNGKRISNGPIESMNSRVKNIIHNSYGFTNFKRFRNKAMFSLNKNEPIKMR